MIHLLHISDLHIGKNEEVGKYRSQIETDLKKNLEIERLNYLIISGDITATSIQEEYDSAVKLIKELSNQFSLNPKKIIVVPGNHDVNWDLSMEAYSHVFKNKLKTTLKDGQYYVAGEDGILLVDDNLYKNRFDNFNNYFFKKIKNEPYPAEYIDQGILDYYSDDKILILSLNSCWQIDHHFTKRASINMESLSEALNHILDDKYDCWMKIAVWHHPVFGIEMMNDDFLQQLSVHNFQLCIHGHIHEAKNDYFKYDHRGLNVVGAGTFGAPAKQQVPGIPLQYNLMTYYPNACLVRVNTRKKIKPGGAWSADARWGDQNNPKPYYEFKIHLSNNRANNEILNQGNQTFNYSGSKKDRVFKVKENDIIKRIHSQMEKIPGKKIKIGLSNDELEYIVEFLTKYRCFGDLPKRKCKNLVFEIMDEDHQRSVTVDAFMLSRYPVTNEIFEIFIENSGYKTIAELHDYDENWIVAKDKNGPDHPVTHVCFKDVLAFCNWANVRIPTSIEYERAVRGFEQRLFPWGERWHRDRCNDCLWSGEIKTSSVKRFRNAKSQDGIYDLCGNVYEWVISSNEESDIQLLAGGSFKVMSVLRGNASLRMKSSIIDSYEDVGFRIAKDI